MMKSNEAQRPGVVPGWGGAGGHFGVFAARNDGGRACEQLDQLNKGGLFTIRVFFFIYFLLFSLIMFWQVWRNPPPPLFFLNLLKSLIYFS